jgi:hypothetical protein
MAVDYVCDPTEGRSLRAMFEFVDHLVDKDEDEEEDNVDISNDNEDHSLDDIERSAKDEINNELPDPSVTVGDPGDTAADRQHDLFSVFQGYVEKWKTQCFEDGVKLEVPKDIRLQVKDLFTRINIIGLSFFGVLNVKSAEEKLRKQLMEKRVTTIVMTISRMTKSLNQEQRYQGLGD